MFVLSNNIFSRIFLFVVTKSAYEFCSCEHIFPDKMLVTNKVCIYFLLLPTRKSCKNVVDQHTVYTVPVTTNILSGKICLYQQSLYILFVTTNKKILENILVINTHTTYTIYVATNIFQ